ncbi:putative Acid alpha glucosidase protein [Naja naja]|nr:putative Acid alpha glucosidase protein [Naja naja]
MEKGGAAHGVFFLNSNLMGFPAMPPFWGLGFHLCRWGYGTSNKTWETVKAMRSFQIPQDAQWNDIDYMNSTRDFAVDSEKFASLPQMVEDLHKHGQYYVLILDPGISSTQRPGSYWPYDEGLKRGVFINDTEGKPLIGKDMNEPSNFVDGSTEGCSKGDLDNPPYTPAILGGSLSAKTICASAKQNLSVHYNLHNLYGLMEAKATSR